MTGQLPPQRAAGYELLAPLAQGPSGAVFLARDATGRHVVWKRHEPGEGERGGLAELQLLGLRHPGLAACLDAGRLLGDGRLYTVTEHVQGAAFGPEALGRAGLSPERALALAARLLSALAAVHDRGLLHRDLKDDNLRLEVATDRPVILDFGLCCTQADAPRLPAAGTPRAMAPELFSGAPATVASDLWAVGLVLAEALLGRRLARAREPEALLREWAAWTGLPPEDLARLQHPALAALLRRLLAPAPEQRPQDAHAALAALAPLPEDLRAELAAQSLDVALSGALLAADGARTTRLAALTRGALWVPAFATPHATLGDALRAVRVVLEDASGALPALAARLQRAQDLPELRPVDLAGLLEALAAQRPLVLELGQARAVDEARVGERRELGRLLAERPGIALYDEPPLESAVALAVLGHWLGERPVLAQRLAAAPPRTREDLGAALGALLLAGVVRASAGGVRVDETALPAAWPATDAAALPAGVSTAARELLALLALGPRSLSAEECAAALGRPVHAALEELQALGLVLRQRSEPDARFAPADARFARSLLAVAPVSAELRARLARILAGADTAALDDLQAAAVAEVLGAEAPAHHDDEALTRLIAQAADVLRRVGRVELAAELLRRGIAGAGPAGPHLRRLWLDLADMLVRANRHEQALAAVAEARAQLGADPALEVRAARAQFLRGQLPEALATLDRLPLDDLPREDALLALQVRSQVRHEAGRLPEALADAREALRRAGEPGDRRTMSLLELAAVLEARLGHLDEAVRYYEACIALARRIGQGLLVGSPMYNLGRAISARGERRRGLAVQEDGARHLEQAGDLVNLAQALNSLGAEWISLGRLDTARRHLSRALELARRLSAPGLAAMVLNNTGRALAAEGRHEEAEASFAESLAIRAGRGDRRGQAAVALTRGPVRLQRGRLAEAAADLALAREQLAGLKGAGEWEVDAELLDARLALASGAAPAAVAAAGRALEQATRHGLTNERLMALDLQARAGGPSLGGLDAERLERGPWLADLLVTRAGARAAAGRWPEADADMAAALSMLGESPDGPVEARGLLQRAEGDQARLAQELSRPEPDYGKVGAWLARAARDTDRARVLVEVHDLAPLRDRLSQCAARLAAAGDGDEMSGLSVLSERLRNLERLAEINKALNTERDTQRLLELIVDSAIEITGAARGFLILFDGRSEEFRAARHIDESTIHNPEFEVSHSVARRVVKEGRALITANAIDDPRFGSAASISELKLLSILCVPLVSRERTLGAIYLDHPQVVGRFDERHLGTVTALAEQAAIALENARLSEGLALTNKELRDSREEIARLNEALQSRLVQREAELEEARESLDASRRALELRYDYSNIVTCSPAMHAVMDLLDRITDTDFPVLIQGESGTGKELIARAIHFNGARRSLNFVSLNCAAIAEPLIESEFFGHVRGAFTGADRDHKGLFEQAHGGTLFLDEIGDMSAGVQKRLLRVLQEGEFLPVGGRELRKVDVRILCATHRDLKTLVGEGDFRDDLYYRLAVVEVRLPPLRARSEDIALLLPHFLERHGSSVRSIEPEALSLLRGQPWPGNVRELENFARNLLLFDRDGTRVGAALVRRLLAGNGVALPAAPDAPGADDAGAPIRDRVLAFERRLVEEALARAGGNKSRAAKDLGVGIRTFYKMLERLGL